VQFHQKEYNPVLLNSISGHVYGFLGEEGEYLFLAEVAVK